MWQKSFAVLVPEEEAAGKQVDLLDWARHYDVFFEYCTRSDVDCINHLANFELKRWDNIFFGKMTSNLYYFSVM